MPRRRGAEADTRTALIDAATALFALRGVDSTSVEAVLEQTGLSRGTFYHWFPSRSDLLDAVVGRMVEVAFAEVHGRLPGPDRPAVERLAAWLALSRSWRLDNYGLVREAAAALYREENAALLRRMDERSIQDALPIVSEILAQGEREGAFQVEDPEETALVLLHGLQAVGAFQVRCLLRGEIDPTLRRIGLILRLVERALGAPAGSLAVPHAQVDRLAALSRGQSDRPGGAP
jgi:AcrR family transcriptional regulator